MHKIYAEAVFADNFAVKFIILLFACRLGCTRIRWGRCALGAALGGVYAAVVFGMDGFAVSFWVKLAVSLAMCAAVFWVRGERHMLRSTAAFYMTAFGFAGAIYAVSLCMEQVQTTGGMLAAPSAVRAVLLGLAAGAGLMGVFARIRRRALQREPHTAVLRCASGAGRCRFARI
jgi:stage II sporulation protein GA (sporulation sigma-E factor processing peptidase)